MTFDSLCDSLRADEDNDDVIESYSLYYIFSVFPSFVYYYLCVMFETFDLTIYIFTFYHFILELTTIFTEILKASHNNQTSIFAFTFKFKFKKYFFKILSCLLRCSLLLMLRLGRKHCE